MEFANKFENHFAHLGILFPNLKEISNIPIDILHHKMCSPIGALDVNGSKLRHHGFGQGARCK